MHLKKILKFAAPVVIACLFSAYKREPEVSATVCDEAYFQPVTELNADQRMACFMAGKFAKFNKSY